MNYRELINLGLTEKESKVYLASLKLGKSAVQKIATTSKVNRATTYVIIENLMEKGLMSSYTEGKKQFFIAESPEKLSLLFREQQMEIQKKQEYLDKILPELKSLKQEDNEGPVVRYYKGKEGIIKMLQEFSEIKKEETVILAYSVDSTNAFFSKEETKKWIEKRKNQKQKTKAIYTFKDGEIPVFKNNKVKKVPLNKYPITSDIAVYNNKIRMASLNNKIGLIIEDKEMAQTMKAILALAWEGANNT